MGDQSFGRGGGLTNTGLLMPNFGSHPWGFPPAPFMDPMAFGAMHFGMQQQGLPPDLMMHMAGDVHRGFPGGVYRGPMPAELMVPQMPGRDQESPKPLGPAAVPQARLDEETGEVTVTFKGKEIVKVSRGGVITLDSGGVRGPAVFMALNAVLNVVGISITRPKKDDEWSISDGRSLTRFRDGVVLQCKGPQSAQRGPKIVAAFGGADPSAAAAATAASNAAAAAAGIVLPGRGSGKGGKAEPRSRKEGNTGKSEANGSHIQSPITDGKLQAGERRSDGVPGHDSDTVRRLKAKGRYPELRYRPY